MESKLLILKAAGTKETIDYLSEVLEGFFEICDSSDYKPNDRTHGVHKFFTLVKK